MGDTEMVEVEIETMEGSVTMEELVMRTRVSRYDIAKVCKSFVTDFQSSGKILLEDLEIAAADLTNVLYEFTCNLDHDYKNDIHISPSVKHAMRATITDLQSCVDDIEGILSLQAIREIREAPNRYLGSKIELQEDPVSQQEIRTPTEFGDELQEPRIRPQELSSALGTVEVLTGSSNFRELGENQKHDAILSKMHPPPNRPGCDGLTVKNFEPVDSGFRVPKRPRVQDRELQEVIQVLSDEAHGTDRSCSPSLNGASPERLISSSLQVRKDQLVQQPAFNRMHSSTILATTGDDGPIPDSNLETGGGLPLRIRCKLDNKSTTPVPQSSSRADIDLFVDSVCTVETLARTDMMDSERQKEYDDEIKRATELSLKRQKEYDDDIKRAMELSLMDVQL